MADVVGLCVSCKSSWYWTLTSQVTSPLSARLRLFMMVIVLWMVPPPSSEVELMAYLELTVFPLVWAMGLWLWYHCMVGLGEPVASQVKETVLSSARDVMSTGRTVIVGSAEEREGRRDGKRG